MTLGVRGRAWAGAAGILALNVLQAICDLKIPEYTALLTRLAKTGGAAPDTIGPIGLRMGLYAVASLALSVVTLYLATSLATGQATALRARVFERIERFSQEEMRPYSVATLVNRTTHDVMQVFAFVSMGAQVVFKAPIMIAMIVGKMPWNRVAWTAAALGALAFLCVLMAAVYALSYARFTRMQSSMDRLSLLARQNLMGLRSIRALRAQHDQENRFAQTNRALEKDAIFANRAVALLEPFTALAVNGVTLAVYVLGARMISGAQSFKLAIFSDMIVFSMYVALMVMALTMLTGLALQLPRTVVALGRIRDVTRARPARRFGAREGQEPGQEGRVEFRDVSLRYRQAEAAILGGVSFTVPRGATVAVLGSMGSGKSALLQLAGRLCDPTSGMVMVGGADARDYAPGALEKFVGYVPQRPAMFDGSVAFNVSLEERADGERLDWALSVAQAKEFVDRMPGGREARVARGGVNLSGGQAQRLAVARALYRRPSVYLFDDAFSELDNETEARLVEALKAHTRGCARLVVTQRPDTARGADIILVLENGRVAGAGDHEALLKDCAVYREIVGAREQEAADG